jgi:hypothetical protein
VTMQTTIAFLAEPRNQKAVILKRLIEGEMISERDTVYNGFRTRISEPRIDYGVPIRFNWKPFVNEFGHARKIKVITC